VDLPPGEYYIQAIYNNWLNAIWHNAPGYEGVLPAGIGENEPQLYPRYTQTRMNEPIGISKPAKITVRAKNEAVSNRTPLPNSPIRVELSLNNPSPMVGQRATAVIRFTNQTDITLEVFAPHFHKFHRTIELAALTPEGKYIADLGKIERFSYHGPIRNDWLTFPPGGTTSTEFDFPVGFFPQSAYPSQRLSIGKYQLEVRVHGHFISGCPSDVERATDPQIVPPNTNENAKDKAGKRMTYEEWERTLPGPEICRSNRVELEILPRSGD